MTTATKTKREKLTTIYPPRDIVENTKARRAWIDAKVAELNAQPNTEAKSVGMGSYQSVSVYRVTQVEGRLRLRGICQYCGHSQVVENDVLVLHGYKRPGDGATYGRCPGMGRVPLQTSNESTTSWHAQYTEHHAALVGLHAKCEATERAARDAMYVAGSTNYDRHEPEAYKTRPHLPSHHNAAELEAYLFAKAEWAKRNPLTAAFDRAEAATRKVNHDKWQAEGMVRHFADLLKLNLTGTPLTAEVVA